MRILLLPTLALSFVALTNPAKAAINLYAEYHLGEPGSLGASNLPIDSSGNGRNFINEIAGASAFTITSGTVAPGSTAYLSTSGAINEGWYASNLFSSLPTDNFGFGVWARASALGNGDIFTVGGSNGSLKLSLGGNGWAASANNVAWIGQDSGVSGSFTPDTWVHLAMIRNAGTTRFYINDVVNGTYSGVPINDTAHLSVSPGGGSYFHGGMDEARVVTFTAGESDANVLGALKGIPEPTSAACLLAGLGVVFARRRRAE